MVFLLKKKNGKTQPLTAEGYLGYLPVVYGSPFGQGAVDTSDEKSNNKIKQRVHFQDSEYSEYFDALESIDENESSQSSDSETTDEESSSDEIDNEDARGHFTNNKNFDVINAILDVLDRRDATSMNVTPKCFHWSHVVPLGGVFRQEDVILQQNKDNVSIFAMRNHQKSTIRGELHSLMETIRSVEIPEDVDAASVMAYLSSYGEVCIVGAASIKQAESSVDNGNLIWKLYLSVEGFKPEEMCVKLLNDSLLSISAEQTTAVSTNGYKLQKRFAKTVCLPEDINVDYLESCIDEAGVLKITAPYKIDTERILSIQNEQAKANMPATAVVPKSVQIKPALKNKGADDVTEPAATQVVTKGTTVVYSKSEQKQSALTSNKKGRKRRLQPTSTDKSAIPSDGNKRSQRIANRIYGQRI